MLEVHVTVTTLALLIVILIVFLVGLLLYLFPASSKLTSIPGPNVSDDKEGNITDIARAGSFHQYLCEVHKDYGSVAAFKYGRKLIVSVANPKHFVPRLQICDIPDFLFDSWKELVGQESFLFTKGVDTFKRRENVECNVTSFHREHYAKIFLSLSNELVKKWRGTSEGQHIPLTQHMKGLAIKAVCQMMFGDYFQDSARLIKLHNAWDLCWNEVIATTKKEPTKTAEKIKEASKDLRQLVEDAIEYNWSKSSSERKSDALVIKGLLEASNDRLTGDELVADVLTLFTVGLQVTWAVLTWNVYLVMSHAEVQNELRDQLQSIDALDIMPETLNDMKTLNCVIKETLRYSGMFTCSARKHDMNVTIDSHVVPSETPIIEAIAVAMNQESLWAEPYKYNPSRFLEKKEPQLNPLDYIPFAFGGSRRDPKSSLVYLLTSIVLASVFREFQLNVVGEDVSCESCNYDSFVVMPAKEEIWGMINRKVKKRIDAEVIG